MIVRQHEVDVAAEVQPTIDEQTADGRKIVRLEADAILVEALDRRIGDRRRDEAFNDRRRRAS